MSDQELLQDYAERRSETAFAELVRRHVDLVYSAALRMVCEDHAAKDVTQAVFVALAQNASQLARHPVLSGWLHCTARNLAANSIRSEVRRQAREQEAAIMNELLSAEPDASWENIAPHVDAALGELSEPDRDALLLRYFERKSAREIAAILGISDEAAQKRVSRAVDRMREFLSKRGAAVGASGLVFLISANAVQSAPVGLAVQIAAGVMPATTATAATAAAKTIAMTTLQKTIIGAALATAIGAGIFEAHQASQLRDENQALQQQQAPLAAQIQKLQRERDDATNRLAAVNGEIAQLKSGQNTSELLRLRGQVGSLQRKAASAAQTHPPATGFAQMMKDPAMKEYIRRAQATKIKSLYSDLFKELKLSPDQSDQVLQTLCDAASKAMERLTTTGQTAPDPVGTEDGKAIEDRLRQVLGDEGFGRFKEFSTEIPARTTVGLLNDQLGNSPLNDDQGARLLQVVKSEPYNLTQGITGAPDKAFLGSQSDIDNFLQQLTESNQRILQQAGGFLTPDQLTALNTVLTNAIGTRQLQAAALIQQH